MCPPLWEYAEHLLGEAGVRRESARIFSEEGLCLRGAAEPGGRGARLEGDLAAEGNRVSQGVERVGPQGRAIGVDMTPDMVARARQAAESRGVANVEFHEALIEKLPLEDDSADVVLSNCVINLSPDKPSVFREAFRVLRPGGRLVISDIVQERPLGAMDDNCGCVANAMVRAEYLDVIRASGFTNIEVLEDRPWLQDSQEVKASAVTVRAEKPSIM